MFPLASLAHTWALTDSASLTGWPGGTITTRVGVQPSGISASKEIVAEAIVFLSVFKGLVFLIDDLVEGRSGDPFGDACRDRVHKWKRQRL
jgi:hypothetical protein